MKNILNRLFNHEKLSREEAKTMLINIAREMYNPIQVATFTAVYNMRPITIEELEGFRDALLELRVKVDLEGIETIDIVGTGGDGKNTFNVSTTSAIVVAGAGYKVTKHGSYGVSSSVGSSNVLMALGYEFTDDIDRLKKQLDTANICFFHAPLFHPALKAVVPIRKQLGMKSFFNMLGPLVNPAQPKYQVFGTFSLELSRLYQYVMQQTERAFAIVYALDGYDEVSLTSSFKWRTRNKDTIYAPSDLGKPTYKQTDLYGGETAEAGAAIFKSVLENTATQAQFDVVAANAGMAIHIMKPTSSIQDCIQEAEESIRSGKAINVLKKITEN